MLTELRITGLGVIEDATLEFAPGLTVLTGETGAGKTMVVTGLSLLFGSRADAGMLRLGSVAASIEGLLEVDSDNPALARARDAGADVTDGLILVRSLTETGRSRAHVGGRSVPVGVLAALAEDLVAVHGQADQWRLRSPEEQRNVLDAFGGAEVAQALGRYRQTYSALGAARAERQRLTALVEGRANDLADLREGVARIEAIDPQPGEDHALRLDDERLGHADQLRVGASSAAAALLGDDAAGAELRNAATAVAAARSALAGLEAHDAAIGHLDTRLAELAMLVSEVGGDLAAYADAVDVDGERLAALQQRRAELATLTRRHGGDIDEVLAWLVTASARLLEADNAGDLLARARSVESELTGQLGAAAADLSSLRRVAAGELASAVTAELAHLAMGSAALSVEVGVRPDPDGLAVPGHEEPLAVTNSGIDDVAFLLAPNVGLPARPLAKAASGGELSRVMLAIEVVLGARTSTVPTFVFDEVDAGVGGRAALDVGARLAQLARRSQVVVVTHLAQVAAFADRHLVVTKDTTGVITNSAVSCVDGAAREREIARMMAGSDSATALAHARELLAQARDVTVSWHD